MRKLTCGGGESEQAVVADKVARRALAGISRTCSGAVVDVNAVGDGLARGVDSASTDPAIVCRSRPICREQSPIGQGIEHGVGERRSDTATQKEVGELATAPMGQLNAFFVHTSSAYLYQAAQLPSEDTMHGPTGDTGVQRERKREHWSGVIFPWIISPQRHPAG